ncbi:MAG: efflux RND transporter periplasmic adaptor subunit [Alphaproteobacteria bacterium]|nr:efflux RND transporter periplasmic adaptor subunit [Alphaproteobacteria bacterium]
MVAHYQLSFAVLVAASIAGCSQTDRAGSESTNEAITVTAQSVAYLPEQRSIEAIGTARAQDSAQIFPRSDGVVTAVLFEGGDYVRKGAPLVRLESNEEQLAVELAQNAVREAEQLLGRYRRIEDTGALSASQIEQGETALVSAQIQLRQARLALSERIVRAPFSGHVGLTEIDRGDRVNDSTPITQIDQRGTLYVDFSAPESVFAALRPGQVVEVTPFSDPARTIEARVVTTDTRISQDSRDFIVRTAIPNSDDQLRPGMSFRVVFTRNGETRAAVPEQAIVWGGEGSHLFVVREGKARRVPVTITARREGLVFVDGRVAASDRVIVEGVQKVREGQDIRLVQPRGAAPQEVRVRPAATANDGE